MRLSSKRQRDGEFSVSHSYDHYVAIGYVWYARKLNSMELYMTGTLIIQHKGGAQQNMFDDQNF